MYRAPAKDPERRMRASVLSRPHAISHDRPIEDMAAALRTTTFA
jgi:hypothetical protein